VVAYRRENAQLLRLEHDTGYDTVCDFLIFPRRPAADTFRS
jgi:hypothetical protein